MEQRKSTEDAKGKAQVGRTPLRLNTKDLVDGGSNRSSNEASVMGVERRVGVEQSIEALTTAGDGGKINAEMTKHLPISKQMVYAAYLKVKSNKGASGVDKVSLKAYESKLGSNLYVLWNRLGSGSYFPPPVLEVEIPKGDGGVRKLGIPTVEDRIAQQVIKAYLEPRFETIFKDTSYGYRPGRSAHNALQAVRQQVWRQAWVLDMDIKGFFDNVRHDLLNKALAKHVPEEWVLMYINRWLESGILTTTGSVTYREGRGTPQGGVISPLLANLYLHYAVDAWLELEHPEVKYVRYADDIIIHAQTETQIRRVQSTLAIRLQNCGLEMHPEKTKIVFCKKSNRSSSSHGVHKFDFLGYSFQPRTTKDRRGQVFVNYDCAISHKSEKKIKAYLRQTKFHLWNQASVEDLAIYFNEKIIGWYNYYGKFNKYRLSRIFTAFHDRLKKWLCRRYKRFKKSHRKADQWLRNLIANQPDLFYHWKRGFTTA